MEDNRDSAVRNNSDQELHTMECTSFQKYIHRLNILLRIIGKKCYRPTEEAASRREAVVKLYSRVQPWGYDVRAAVKYARRMAYVLGRILRAGKLLAI